MIGNKMEYLPGMLEMTVGRDCKFKENRTPTGERILKQGIRARVSYFATISLLHRGGDRIDPVLEVNRAIIEKLFSQHW